jgi:hypothetical protein
VLNDSQDLMAWCPLFWVQSPFTVFTSTRYLHRSGLQASRVAGVGLRVLTGVRHHPCVLGCRLLGGLDKVRFSRQPTEAQIFSRPDRVLRTPRVRVLTR